MPKTSIDYAELAGLRIAIITAKTSNAHQVVLDWIDNRIKELEKI